MLEVVNGKIPYGEDKIPSNIIVLQNLIVNFDTDNVVDRVFHDKEAYGEGTREFAKLCLQRVAERLKYDGLKETEFYKKYSEIEQKEVKGYLDELYYGNPVTPAPENEPVHHF